MLIRDVLYWNWRSKSGIHIGLPSWGLRNCTPSSVTLASLRRLTIWKLKTSLNT